MSAAEPIPSCPYQGLEPFSEQDRPYFFGREVDTQRIGANLVTSSLTIFYGASGVGKTSVLLAGVLPFVHQQPGITAIVFRKWQAGDFERELKSEIANAVASQSDRPLNVEQTLDRVLDESARLTGGTIAMVFDQFEEYMLYHAPSSAEGRSFDTAFARAVNRNDTDVNFLIGIREDALARLDRFRQYIPDLLSNRQQLVHLDERGAEEAIRGPLEHYNEVVRARGETALAMEIEDSLVAELIRQVRIGGVSFGGTGRVDTNVVRVETPFLQMVLMKLWKAERDAKSSVMREKTLHDLGDARKIVLDHVDGVMAALDAAERDAASAIFDRLVTPSRSKIAYALSDLEAFAGPYAPAIPSLVEKLCNVRILRPVASSEGQVGRYEIFHDVLSEAVLAWRAKHLRDLEEAAAKKRRIGCAVMIAVLLAVVFGIFSWMQLQRNARVEAQQAREAERARALKIEAELARLRTESTITMSQTEEGKRDEQLLRRALDAYEQLGDRGGKERVLRQLAALYVTREDYASAASTYRAAMGEAASDVARRDLEARVLLAEGQDRAKAGDHAAASDRYMRAAASFQVNGDFASQQQALSSAAAAYQNLAQLDLAEKTWQSALQIQKRLKDVEGQSRSLAGLASIEKQRRLRAVPVVVTDTAPPAQSPDPCTLDSMDGYWAEVAEWRPRQVQFVWQFKVERGKGGASMSVARLDGSVRGDFVYNDEDTSFSGTLHYLSDVRKNVVIQMPSEQQNCGRIVTNQSFYFVRTKAPAAAY